MLDADLHAERARKNRRLALVLFGTSFAILGAMIALVILTRTGVLGRMLHHMGQLY